MNGGQGLIWESRYDDILGKVATSNLVPPEDWPLVRQLVKYKLAKAIEVYLNLGEPYPLAPTEAHLARDRALEAIDIFVVAPFTLQRIVELVCSPQRYYSTLPKYLRALTRVINVTIDVEDERPDSLGSPLVPEGGMEATENGDDESEGTTRINGMGTMSYDSTTPSGSALPPPTKRPWMPSHASSSSVSSVASSSSSSSSTSAASSSRMGGAPTPTVPLLSPIPWLVVDTDASTTDAVNSWSAHQSGLSSSPPNPATLVHPTSPQRLLALGTPTGGLVDELDLGLGSAETGDPIALTSVSTSVLLSPPRGGAGGAGLGPGQGERSSTLAERFVRASSPRVDKSPEPESAAPGV